MCLRPHQVSEKILALPENTTPPSPPPTIPAPTRFFSWRKCITLLSHHSEVGGRSTVTHREANVDMQVWRITINIMQFRESIERVPKQIWWVSICSPLLSRFLESLEVTLKELSWPCCSLVTFRQVPTEKSPCLGKQSKSPSCHNVAAL